jgi:hypothetical protein
MEGETDCDIDTDGLTDGLILRDLLGDTDWLILAEGLILGLMEGDTL